MDEMIVRVCWKEEKKNGEGEMKSKGIEINLKDREDSIIERD